MRLAVYTTAYPAALRFLPGWYASVALQSDRNFDLWVGLDGMQEAEFYAAIGSRPPVHFSYADSDSSPAGLRSAAMANIVKRYDGIVFADADDVLCPTRISSARQGLDDWDVTGCSLCIIDENGQDLGITFGPPAEYPVERLARYNVFGLSNTAYRCAVLERCLPVQDDCVLVDWLLATRAWSAGASMHFDASPGMKYRQYTQNTASVLGPFTSRVVLQATRRVLHHYRCALDRSWPLRHDARIALEAARADVTAFYSAVTASAGILATYVHALNDLPREYIWWWAVAHPDLQSIWKR